MLRDKNAEAVTIELRDKIKSKIDVAKFFSGFIPIFLGLAFKEMVVSLNSSDPLVYRAAWIGVSFILLALAFSIATLFALDRLLMPPEFWITPPEEEFNTTLMREMVSAWLRLFYTAVFCFLAGITAFLVALTKQVLVSVVVLAIVILLSWLVYKSLIIGHKIHG